MAGDADADAKVYASIAEQVWPMITSAARKGPSIKTS
jgi:hypothetical protein